MISVQFPWEQYHHLANSTARPGTPHKIPFSPRVWRKQTCLPLKNTATWVHQASSLTRVGETLKAFYEAFELLDNQKLNIQISEHKFSCLANVLREKGFNSAYFEFCIKASLIKRKKVLAPRLLLPLIFLNIYSAACYCIIIKCKILNWTFDFIDHFMD